jgi:hypothetical protein
MAYIWEGIKGNKRPQWNFSGNLSILQRQKAAMSDVQDRPPLNSETVWAMFQETDRIFWEVAEQ